MHALLLALLLAATPRRPDPGLEPDDVAVQYRAWAAAQGVSGPAAELVCRPFATRAALCFSRPKGKGRTWWTQADGKDADALLAAGKGTAPEALDRLEAVPVEGFTQVYWMAARGDGRDHTPVLFPEELRAKVGGDVVVGVPARGVLVAWRPGQDLGFDKAVAVGVRRMYDTLPDAVSPLLYRWDGKAWTVWGQAVPAEPAQPGG